MCFAFLLQLGKLTFMPLDRTILLESPADAAAWRSRLPPIPEAVVVVTGTFEILQPGNLEALRQAMAIGSRVVVVVEEDGAVPSQAARGGGIYPLPDRLACVTFLKKVAAAIPGRTLEAPALFRALSPFTWVGCPFPDDGPVAAAALRAAALKKELPVLPGCRTSEIGTASRDGRTPIPVPSPSYKNAPRPEGAPAPAATVNGCFDVLHIGHFRFLDQAAALAGPVTLLVNSDASIRRYKGAGRPVFPFPFRREALLALRAVAEVYPFEEDEPLALLAVLKPPLHIKGGTREPDRVRHEEDLLRQWGGKVEFCSLVQGYSTSAYLSQIRQTGGAL